MRIVWVLSCTRIGPKTCVFFGDGGFGDPTLRMLQVTMDTTRCVAASVITYITLSLNFSVLLLSRSDAEDDPASPETDRLGGTQFQHRGAGLFFTFQFFILYLLLAAIFVQSRVLLMGRNVMHVLLLPHAENRRRAHPGGGSGAEHAPAQERPEKLSEEQRAPAGREWHRMAQNGSSSCRL